ncbi:hypothetical protein RDWZM_009309 [Blomia tropicalis]|uniref:Uncharacterized protein n=1 Tax=Blomia tropicalis TaxID=40697 RepID=A0A9Q0M3D2_BLOTA|nr:hypothetical protein RDWZM_009309 [Blomia tropicalis]
MSNSKDPYRLYINENSSRPLVRDQKVTNSDGITATAYQIELPDNWGALTVRYEQRPANPDKDPEDSKHNLRIIMKLNNSFDKNDNGHPLQPVHSQADSLPNDTFSSLNNQMSQVTCNDPTIGYMKVDWPEWHYISAPNDQKSTTSLKSNSNDPSVNEVLTQLREQFDLIMKRYCNNQMHMQVHNN